ncbi:hypothetical protein [Tenacibaculum ovolyticum]|uniref:hypothetical protein n=1 Tax=Tenacibaculum ovolyticum TaxID=104270 RepID=UPI0012DE7CC7|nr:hypothetical protein [Tenacibaculum ovolyticum]
MDSNGENFPSKGNEIDLMKYYNGKKPVDFYERRVASKEDLIGLIWLTKLKIKK